MSHKFEEQPHNAITDSNIARVIPCKELDWGDPFKWLKLGFRDMLKAPHITAFFGVVFALVPYLIYYLVELTGWHLVIMPALVCFMLIGPLLAAGLYDVSWELEKGHVPSIWHSIKAVSRNLVNELAFGILLMVIMIFWLRCAAIIHAFYPEFPGESLAEQINNMLPFLTIGSLVGSFFVLVVFFISAFTQPTLMERKVDLATAVMTSVSAVWLNKGVMAVWASIICGFVAFGFVVGILLDPILGFGSFIFSMPLIGYATWHAYIDTIETKRQRKYE